jgi:hypothetical protein
MFDREYEWAALTGFATDPTRGATLGVVSGRRRQGKTFLLRSLCQATGGFYFAADEATDGESLHRVGEVLADYLGSPAPLAFDSWHQVMDALLALGRDRTEPIPVVIDEFPYLGKANPRLPSIVQNALAHRPEDRRQLSPRLSRRPFGPRGPRRTRRAEQDPAGPPRPGGDPRLRHPRLARRAGTPLGASARRSPPHHPHEPALETDGHRNPPRSRTGRAGRTHTGGLRSDQPEPSGGSPSGPNPGAHTFRSGNPCGHVPRSGTGSTRPVA